MTAPFLAPPLWRRLCCMAYEALLTFGLLFVAGYAFDLLTHSRHTLLWRSGRQIWLFSVLGCYFVYCWHRSGQTLAMHTWKIRLTDLDGKPLPLIKACVRYLLAWLWVAPALGVIARFELQRGPMLAALCIGGMAWAVASGFDRDRQFLHDRLAKTRLVDLRNSDATKRDQSP